MANKCFYASNGRKSIFVKTKKFSFFFFVFEKKICGNTRHIIITKGRGLEKKFRYSDWAQI